MMTNTVNRWVPVFSGVTFAILMSFTSPLNASSKESYLQKAQSEIKSFSAKVEALQKKSETAGNKTRIELDRHLKVAREDLDLAERKLSELQKSSEVTWTSLRRGTDEALREVKHAYAKASAVFDKSSKKGD